MRDAHHGALEKFILSLPKTETHLHLEGSIPWEMIHQADPIRFAHPPASHQPDFKFGSFAEFEGELLTMAAAVIKSEADYGRIAEAIFARHVAQNVKYVEISVASGCIEAVGLDTLKVLRAVKDAVPEGLTVKLFMGIHHNGWTSYMAPEFEKCLHYSELDGFDLHGPETIPLEDWTRDFWQRARRAGKMTKAHAGEFRGADFVRTIVNELEVKRIEHGVRSVEDASVVRLLAEQGIALDICPISNAKLDVVSSLSAHPIRKLMAAGIICTVSTDDTSSFGNTLVDEYVALAEHLDFDRHELVQVAANGFRVANIAEEERERYLAQLQEINENIVKESKPITIEAPFIELK